MNERNIVAAILAGNLATQVRETGNSFAVAAEHAVLLYDAILKELAKADLPPREAELDKANSLNKAEDARLLKVMSTIPNGERKTAGKAEPQK